jgi:hypothetical protein
MSKRLPAFFFSSLLFSFPSPESLRHKHMTVQHPIGCEAALVEGRNIPEHKWKGEGRGEIMYKPASARRYRRQGYSLVCSALLCSAVLCCTVLYKAEEGAGTWIQTKKRLTFPT